MSTDKKIIGCCNHYRTNKFINNSFPEEELKSIQRSIAKQQQTLNKILNTIESIKSIKLLGGN